MTSDALSAETQVRIQIGDETLLCRLECASSPETCAWFKSLMPFKGRLIQGRWSGHAVFARIGALASALPEETPLAEPAAGQIVVYRSTSAKSDGEILIAYGPTRFANPSGGLQGNLLMTVLTPIERLSALGREIHICGAQDARFELVEC